MSLPKHKQRRIYRELSFRSPLAVKEVFVFPSGSSYPICPRCKITLEREYQKLCDRCGQKLDWSLYDSAAQVTSIS